MVGGGARGGGGEGGSGAICFAFPIGFSSFCD